MRQLGWLSAVPESPRNFKGEPDMRSRIQRLEAGGQEADLPDVTAEHLLRYLMEIGPSMPAGAGIAAISHGEIRSWQENTGIELSAWEARALRDASREFVSELYAAKDPRRPAPYGGGPTTVQVAADMRAAIRKLVEK